MERVPDSLTETHNLRLRSAGSVAEGQVTTQQVQQGCPAPVLLQEWK